MDVSEWAEHLSEDKRGSAPATALSDKATEQLPVPMPAPPNYTNALDRYLLRRPQPQCLCSVIWDTNLLHMNR